MNFLVLCFLTFHSWYVKSCWKCCLNSKISKCFNLWTILICFEIIFRELSLMWIVRNINFGDTSHVSLYFMWVWCMYPTPVYPKLCLKNQMLCNSKFGFKWKIMTPWSDLPKEFSKLIRCVRKLMFMRIIYFWHNRSSKECFGDFPDLSK